MNETRGAVRPLALDAVEQLVRDGWSGPYSDATDNLWEGADVVENAIMAALAAPHAAPAGETRAVPDAREQSWAELLASAPEGARAVIAERRAHADMLQPVVTAWRKHTAAIEAERDALVERVRQLEAALREIAKAEGPFSRDRLTHAENAIASMVESANAALRGATTEAPADA